MSWAGVAALQAVLAVLAVLVAVSQATQEDAKYVAHSGLHFAQLHRVLATSSKLVTFVQDLSEKTFLDQQKKLVSDFREVMEDRNFSKNRTAYWEDVADSLANHYRNTKRLTKLFTVPVVKKKQRRASMFSWNPLTKLGQFCCGFSTYDDLQVAYNRDKQLQEDLKNVHIFTEKLNLERIRQAEATRDLAKKANLVFQTISGNMSKTNKALQTLHQNHVYDSFVMTNMGFLGEELLVNSQRMFSIHTACTAGRIPMEVLLPDKLEKVVKAIQDSYKDAQLSVPLEELQIMYMLEIATCMFPKEDELRVYVKVPLLPKGSSEWEVFDVMPLGFVHEGKVCRAIRHEVMVAATRDLDSFRVMTAQQRHSCLQKKICEVPRVSAVPGVSRECLMAIGALSPLYETQLPPEELRKACKFLCEAYEGVEVTYVGGSRYSVVNLRSDLVVNCTKNLHSSLNLPKTDQGALYVDVPCSCQLIEVIDGAKPLVLVDYKNPCIDETHNPSFVITLPALWSDNRDAIAAMANYRNREPIKVAPAANLSIYLDPRYDSLGAPIPVPVAVKLQEEDFNTAGMSSWVILVWLGVLTAVTVVPIVRQRMGRKNAVTPIVISTETTSDKA